MSRGKKKAFTNVQLVSHSLSLVVTLLLSVIAKKLSMNKELKKSLFNPINLSKVTSVSALYSHKLGFSTNYALTEQSLCLCRLLPRSLPNIKSISAAGYK